ncbi:hypothetical protein ET475_17035 [Microbacterium protaetiae]|uniref:Uncharacterized protein n=1 Tax=Microbacterium protaetiae TaxID=2509458 RepID=A0A4P6ETY7_9MICO|nr:hypothetical protein [Microbacterium protaetiae]QAY61498.1 hypothetical protein ET475_17035 [Microbacterium protaetiae]
MRNGSPITTGVLGLTLAVAVAASLTACAWFAGSPRRETPAVASTSPDPAPSLVLGCGTGFGASAADSGLSDAHPIWSLGWQGVSDGMTPYVITGPDGREWNSVKAPISVAASAGGSVRVVSPASARLVVATAQVWAQAAEVSPLTYIATAADLPACDAVDAYPSLILAPALACVTIRVAPASRSPYEVHVPVGSSDCP